jgi:hypothetical protein
MFDLNKFKDVDVPEYSEKYKKAQGDFLRPNLLLDERVMVANPEFFDYDGLNGVEFDTKRIEHDNQIVRVRSFSKVIMGKFKKLQKDNSLPIIVKFRERMSDAGFKYLDFE